MRNNYRAGRMTVLAAGVALAALTVVGCGASQSASGSTAATSTTNSAPSSNTGSSNAGSGGASGQESSAHTGGGACTTADLSAKLGTKKQIPVDVQGQLGAAGTHYQISLVWTNTSASTCTMLGFGGVDMDGTKNAAGGPTYSLPRTGDAPTTVKLAPGASAHTTISYIDPTGSAPSGTATWTPTSLSVTPPNQTTHITVPWTAGTPVYFDPTDGIAAASISPITAGA